jgi:hypothetical protein
MKYLLLFIILGINLYPIIGYTEQSKNIELEILYKEDQRERKNGTWNTQKDSIRRNIVQKLLDSKSLQHADDFHHAALILHPGQKTEDYKKAHDLALKSVTLNPTNMSVKWLACAAEDRYLHSIGKPQIWGTQFKGFGFLTLDPFDKTIKTDEERIENGVPTIKQTLAYLEKRNRQN